MYSDYSDYEHLLNHNALKIPKHFNRECNVVNMYCKKSVKFTEKLLTNAKNTISFWRKNCRKIKCTFLLHLI